MEKMYGKLKLECMDYFTSNPYSIETTLSVSRRIGRNSEGLDRVLDSLSSENLLTSTQINNEKYYSLLTKNSQEMNLKETVSHLNFQKDFNFLTKREKEVFYQLVDGYTNNQIAEKLIISPDTVKNHITNLYRKLKVNDRVKLIKKFYDSTTD